MFDQAQQDRFWDKVAIGNDGACWLWQGAAYTDRGRTRGRFYANGRSYTASQAATIMAHGERPDGAEHLHSCDEPMCCNPRHLRWGSHAENMADMVERGRHPVLAKTHCKYGHPLTGDNLQKLANRAGRSCKACQKRRKHESIARKKTNG